jgi:alpha-1,6-mannosyltransferase
MNVVLGAAGTILSACVAHWCIQGDQTGRIPSFLAIYALAFAAYLAALHAARGLSARGLRMALLVSMAWRAALVTVPPLLSDDLYRYVWEGRIQLHGGNPYAWDDRPDSPKWATLRDAVWERLNHKDYTAIYPPLWQLATRGVVALDDSPTAMKAFVVVCEALMLLALGRLLRVRGLPPERILVAAWSPLSLLEIAGSGHNEAFGLLFLVLSLLALETRRPLASALAAALAFQSKLVPGFVAAAWWRRYRPFHWLAAVVVAGLLALPYASAGVGLWQSLDKYGRYWLFNETLFAPLAAVAGSHEAAVAIAAGLVVLVAVTLGARRTEPVAAALGVLTAWLLLTPNVLPWYALWLVPLLALRETPAVLLFTGTVVLAYLVYPGWLLGGPWHISWGVRALEYGPCVAVMALDWVRSRRGTA